MLKKQFPCAKFNAFLMMRFAPNDINKRIHKTLIAEADRYSIDVHRADHQNPVRNIWENIKNYMSACELGIAVFDQIQNKYPNSNVCLETGYMLARDLQDKLLLLKETNAVIPSDMGGLLYETFDVDNLEATIRVKLLRWLVDIGVAKDQKKSLSSS